MTFKFTPVQGLTLDVFDSAPGTFGSGDLGLVVPDLGFGRESWNASSAYYGYNDAGQVTSIHDAPEALIGASTGGDLQCFTYDGYQRLIRAWTPDVTDYTHPVSGDGTDPTPCAQAPSVAGMGGPAPYWKNYAYDSAGMRTATTVRDADGGRVSASYARPGAGTVPAHGITGVTSTDETGASTTAAYGYDPTGNTTSRPAPGGGRQQLTWDSEGRLASTTDPATGTTTSYLYDADGGLLIRHTRTTTPNGTSSESTLYAGGTEATVKTTTTTSTTGATTSLTGRRSYRLGGLQVGVRERTDPNTSKTDDNPTRWGTFRFVAGDHHGTMNVALDPEAKQAPVKRYLDPFGIPRGTITANNGQWIDDKGFLGKVTEQATGLTLVGARAYDPSLAAFISIDPLLDPTNPGSLNGYAYANNNPITQSDPDGRRPMCSSSLVTCPGAGGDGNTEDNPGGGTTTGSSDSTGSTANDPPTQNDVAAEQNAKDYAAMQALDNEIGNTDHTDAYRNLADDPEKRANLVAIAASLHENAPEDSCLTGNSPWCIFANPEIQQQAAMMNPLGRGGSLLWRAAKILKTSYDIAHDQRPKGWRIGDDIYAPTRSGKSPAWSTVRGRFWKNEAADPHLDSWSDGNLSRMQRGLAPQRYNRDKGGIESMELSHEPIPFRDGGTAVVARWPQDHAAIDPFRRPGY